MNDRATIERLYEMRLGAMAEAYVSECERVKGAETPFSERFAMVVDGQWRAREEGRLARRLKAAALKVDASLEELDFAPARGLDRAVAADLGELSFLRHGAGVIVTGATGAGKTYLACAIGDRAARRGYTVLYKRLARLLFELRVARADGSYLRAVDKLAKAQLLILDDFGLSALDAQTSADLIDVVDERSGRSSTIVTSQLPVTEWHTVIPDPSIADALLDRLVHTSVRIELKGGSMRKKAARKGSG